MQEYPARGSVHSVREVGIVQMVPTRNTQYTYEVSNLLVTS